MIDLRPALVSAILGGTLLSAGCGESEPRWLPPGYQWANCETPEGTIVPIAWHSPRQADAARPLALLVHGGGWTGGRPDEMVPVAELIYELGYQPVLVRYRRLGEGSSLDDSVADLRAAWRHVADRAADIGGRVEGSIAIGGSAGAHLALWSFGAGGSDAPRPGSLLLLSPVLDTSPETGFGADRLGEEWRKWSPRHAAMGFEGTVLVLHGSDDEVIQVDATRMAVESMVAAGTDMKFTVVEGLPHGFYARAEELARARELIAAWCSLEDSPSRTREAGPTPAS